MPQTHKKDAMSDIYPQLPLEFNLFGKVFSKELVVGNIGLYSSINPGNTQFLVLQVTNIISLPVSCNFDTQGQFMPREANSILTWSFNEYEGALDMFLKLGGA